ncbi:flagellar protein [Peribacillus psychrosaccharolyticus]|uniref:Flagellar protein n=1 Tax=Peribacillus psychrosaccharolyticus TaxID=1407 RepID=A0A974S2M5_PERPY|nr:TIGR02530 family flagellar biosynthesis protein [Peribacillus psychrosaccharolyticus]MEC2053809.1 TIGR02530 family flagellar biosynthesis protein [Peribacillus psychrosaccharolyticus]MED3742577.1 TIGR02530 family flagellar biosynthesis protein [Peribacillus psychrosaccharolyticus]QQT01525.1 flagellar protein [Peribacillus psychrosaccharolyticus]
MEKTVFRPLSSNPILLPPKTSVKQQAQQGFAKHLQSAVDTKSSALSVSKHAQKRLTQRNIEIDQLTWSKIEDKVREAKKMGVTDSLVITQNAALVISAKNNTVITAMGRDEASSQIFTNINGTILLDL